MRGGRICREQLNGVSNSVRIDGNLKIANAGTRGSTRSTGAGPAFHIDEGGGPQRAAAATSAAPPTGVAGLLALQAAEDPALKKKKQIRRAGALLDTLEEIKADLLVGRASEERLNQLMVLVGEARERADPRLDALLDDIELRARVELAKHGVYPR